LSIYLFYILKSTQDSFYISVTLNFMMHISAGAVPCSTWANREHCFMHSTKL